MRGGMVDENERDNKKVIRNRKKNLKENWTFFLGTFLIFFFIYFIHYSSNMVFYVLFFFYVCVSRLGVKSPNFGKAYFVTLTRLERGWALSWNALMIAALWIGLRCFDRHLHPRTMFGIIMVWCEFKSFCVQCRG